MKTLPTESKYKIIRRYDFFFDYLKEFLEGKENNIKGGFYTSVGHFINHTVKYMTMELIDFAIENKIDSLFFMNTLEKMFGGYLKKYWEKQGKLKN